MNLKYGYCKVAACVPETVSGDVAGNATALAKIIGECAARKVDVAITPALSLTGSACGDLFATDTFLDSAINALISSILPASAACQTLIFIGMPLKSGNRIYSCTVAVGGGQVISVNPAKSIATGERVFTPADCIHPVTFKIGSLGVFTSQPKQLIRLNSDDRFLIEVDEHPILHGDSPATLLAVPHAHRSTVGSGEKALMFARALTSNHPGALVLANAGPSESSASGIYGGEKVIAENGCILAEDNSLAEPDSRMIVADIDAAAICWRRRRNGCNRAATSDAQMIEYSICETQDVNILRPTNPQPFLPADHRERQISCSEILSIQSAALATRIKRTGTHSVVIGISGGLDSAVALLACTAAFDRIKKPRTDIIAVTMPGFGTTGRTYDNSLKLCKGLGVTLREIPISDACRQHFKDIGHPEDLHNIVYENAQARERTQILMDIANQSDGIVLGTGDMSENALGWCTYNGDHMSMYAINAGLPKTVIRAIAENCAEHLDDKEAKAALLDILATPVSPELLPASEAGDILQKTENTLGPYEIHDFAIYELLGNGSGKDKILFLLNRAFGNAYPSENLEKWLNLFFKRFFTQQFKRTCQPDAPDIFELSLSARDGWAMPSDTSGSVFSN